MFFSPPAKQNKTVYVQQLVFSNLHSLLVFSVNCFEFCDGLCVGDAVEQHFVERNPFVEVVPLNADSPTKNHFFVIQINQPINAVSMWYIHLISTQISFPLHQCPSLIHPMWFYCLCLFCTFYFLSNQKSLFNWIIIFFAAGWFRISQSPLNQLSLTATLGYIQTALDF